MGEKVELSPRLKKEIFDILQRRKLRESIKSGAFLNVLRKAMERRNSDKTDDEPEITEEIDENTYNFTEEDLKSITSIKLKDFEEGDLQGIELLQNLEELRIQGYKKEYQSIDFTRPEDISIISEEELKAIFKCPKVKKLRIINCGFEKLDFLQCDQPQNIEELVLIENPYLTEVSGIEQLSGLKHIEIYGNNRLFKISQLTQTIKNANGLSEIVLDPMYFPDAISYDPNTGSYDENAWQEIQSKGEKVVWTEFIKGHGTVELDSSEMWQVHTSALKDLDDINDEVMEDHSDLERTQYIATCIAQNIAQKVEIGSTDYHHTQYDENGKIIGKFQGNNSMYNALIHKVAVCEGFTHAMQYELKLKGIKSHNTFCLINTNRGIADELGMSDPKKDVSYEDLQAYIAEKKLGGHSIVCVDDKYYCDLLIESLFFHNGQANESNPLRASLMTKEEALCSHTLSFGERSVEESEEKVTKEQKIKFLKDNNLFKNTRLSSVQDTRAKMAELMKEKEMPEEEKGKGNTQFEQE